MSRFVGALTVFILIVSFQNCSKVGFVLDQDALAAKAQADQDCEDCSEDRAPGDDGGLSGDGPIPGDDGLIGDSPRPGDDDGVKGRGPSDDPKSSLQDECKKIESFAIGQKITIGNVTVVITDLIYKDDSGVGGEVIGFIIEANSTKITYLVKAGTEGYGGSGLSWINPNGTGGSAARGISHIIFCVDIPPAEIYDPSLSGSQISMGE